MPPGPGRLADQTTQLITGWRAVARAKHSEAPIQVQEPFEAVVPAYERPPGFDLRKIQR